MTNKRRIDILKDSRNSIICGTAHYICNTVYVFMDRYPDIHLHNKISESVFCYFPDLLNFKPKNKYRYAGWWPSSDKKSRIEVIDKLIKIYEKDT